MTPQSDADKAEMERRVDKLLEEYPNTLWRRQGFKAGWLSALSGPDVTALRLQCQTTNSNWPHEKKLHEELRELAKDHADDWKRIQDAERAFEQERARREILEAERDALAEALRSARGWVVTHAMQTYSRVAQKEVENIDRLLEALEQVKK